MQIKRNDTVLSIVVSGSIATVIQMVISWASLLLGFIEQNPSIFHARLLTNRFNVGFVEVVLGTFGNFIAGIAFASIIIILLKLTGSDYNILKGALVGIINAMFQFYVLTRLFHNPTLLIPDIPTIVHVYVVYALWGSLVAYISVKYFGIRTHE